MERFRAVAVGNFDGVHRGHQLLLEELKLKADEHGLRPCVVTFTTHPLMLIAPDRAPRMLQSPDSRRSMLEHFGVEVVELPFSDTLRRLSAADFLKMLARRYDARLLMLGHDNRFGYNSHTEHVSHDVLLERYRGYGRECGLEVLAAPCLEGISSSAIRHAIAEGRVEKAAEMLGRPYEFTSTVVHGRQLGRTIGFPTANLDIAAAQTMLPSDGVYAARAITASGHRYAAMVNIGHRPTVDAHGAPQSMEAYLHGFSGNLYGEKLRLQFMRKLREEKKFDSVEELRNRLQADLNMLLSSLGTASER